jgi:uncharacterized membrane protein (DUF4010 family)
MGVLIDPVLQPEIALLRLGTLSGVLGGLVSSTAVGLASLVMLIRVAVLAAVAGLTDVDAITLALATASRDATAPATAGWAIALAVLSNTIAKAGYASWFGGPGFRRGTLVVLGAALIAGLAALLATWPRLGA